MAINRIIANCLTFKDIRTIEEMIYQSPGGFSGKDSPLFFSNPTSAERDLVDRVINGEYYFPATNYLWFYAPKTNWWDQELSGKYKNHCFYKPISGICKQVH